MSVETKKKFMLHLTTCILKIRGCSLILYTVYIALLFYAWPKRAAKINFLANMLVHLSLWENIFVEILSALDCRTREDRHIAVCGKKLFKIIIRSNFVGKLLHVLMS